MPTDWNNFANSFAQGAQQGMGLVNQMRMAPIQRQAAEQELALKAQGMNTRPIEIGGQAYNVPEQMAAQLAQQEEMKRLQMELMKQQRGQLPAGLKLRPGERYNPELGRVEAIPGSTLEQDYISKAAKDSQALAGVKQKTEGGMTAIDEFLNMPGALKSQFGTGYAYLPDKWAGKATKISNPDAYRRIETIKADLRGAGLDLMRSGGSIGQMTENEWPMVESMLGTIKPDMSEDEAKFQLQKVRAKLQSIRDRADQIYNTEWGNTPYVNPQRIGGKVPATGQTLKTASGVEYTVE